MLLEIGYSCFEDGRLVHLPVVLANHGAELRDQHVELVPPLLLGEVPGLPLGLVLLLVVLQVVRHGHGGGPVSGQHCSHGHLAITLGVQISAAGCQLSSVHYVGFYLLVIS